MSVETDGIDLARALQLAVFSVSDDGRLIATAAMPDWWTPNLAELEADGQLRITSLFLQSFYLDAGAIWSAETDGQLTSLLFEISGAEQRMQVQAIAVRQQQANSLILRNLSSLDGWLPTVLQTARENLIEHSDKLTTHAKEVAEISADRDEAQRMEQMKSEFLANMSHEIRTPLTTILGLASMAQQPDRSQPQLAGYVDGIVSAANRLHRLSSDILDLSRIQADRLELDLTDFSLHQLAEDFQQEYQMHAQQRQLIFAVKLDASLPEFVVGDSFRLRQVLSNLAGNALKFTQAGEVRLEIRPSATRPQTHIHFAMHDTGVGISREKLALIFDSFTQVDASSQRRHEGAGLGLAIASKLVLLMDGRLQVDSQLGQGSRFFFEAELPPSQLAATPQSMVRPQAVLPPANLPPAKPSLPKDATTESADSRSVSSDSMRLARILVAEDHGLNRSIIVETLQSNGFQTAEAENGQVAVESWRESKFDVILMDCQMPIMSGLDAISQIRLEEAHGQRIPIVALTAHAMREERQRLLDHGADRYLAKPFVPAELIQLVSELAHCES